MTHKTYTIQEKLKPSGLNGISDNQINDHWKLYTGYVNQVNKLNEELNQLLKDGKGDSLLYADRRRRYGFEYNGMILHEYYFENQTSQKTSNDGTEVRNAIEKRWGSFDAWITDTSALVAAVVDSDISLADLCRDLTILLKAMLNSPISSSP